MKIILELLDKYISMSSIVTFSLGMLTTWLFKKYDFKMQYFKEIINRRIVCYENIIRFLDEFTITNSDNIECLRYYDCMVYRDQFKDVFSVKLEMAIQNSMWINLETRKILSKFHAFYEEYGIQIESDISHKEDTIKYMHLADSEFIKIQSLVDELKLNVVKDLKSLHKLTFSELVEKKKI